MAQNIHILFGFDECTISKQIITCLKTKGYILDVGYRTTKSTIQDYVRRYPNCGTVVIREMMGDEVFSATELAALNDSRLHNVIVLIDESHKGTSFMQVLYSAGITSAIFVSGSTGASDADILNLILHPRNNKKARDYYGIASMKVQVNILTSESYIQNYNYLIDDTKGINIIDRYVCIVNRLPVDQAVDFTRRLPPATLKRIMQYEEFYRVMASFSKRGYKLKYKRPKNLKRGMTDEAFNAYMQGRMPSQVQKENKEPKKKKTVKKAPAEAPVKKEKSKNKEQKEKPQKSVKQVKTAKPAEKPKPVKVPKKVQYEEPDITVKARVSQSRNAFFDEGEQRPVKERAKKRINWKLILIIFVAGILMLTSFYFILSYMLLK